MFYRQERVGKNGRIFKVVKFRTMRVDAEFATGPQWAANNDPRVTRVGKFLRASRLDEIPQLWCVLKGDMAFVGPRPERPEFIEWLTQEIPYYGVRHMVRPGVTGWAQVKYKYGSTIDDAREKLQYDLYYIKNASIGLDLLIMFQTIKTVMLRRGAQWELGFAAKMRWIFWIAAAVVCYAYLGYPLWLWFRSRWSPRPVRRGAIQPSVTAVMVVRNEDAVIARKIENLMALDYPAEKLEFVVVSDGSTDATVAILQGLASQVMNQRLRIAVKTSSEGKAAGLNDALKLASGEIVFFTDARQEIESSALRRLVENFADAEVGCVSGVLMLGDPETGEAGKGMGLYWRIEKKIRELESASGSVVGATGAIYCARRALLESLSLPEGTILDDVLLPMQVVREKSRVVFDSEARAWDSPNLGQSREFSRKVRTLSGNYQLLQLAPWLLTSNNPIRFEFISHKLLRLAVPFALLLVLLASVFLRQPFYRATLVAQVAFYGLSLATIVGLKIGPLARIGDAARTFVVLNSAAVVAFFNFITGRKAIWIR